MEAHEQGEVLTGVFYIDTKKPSFTDMLNLVDEPLATLPESRYAPPARGPGPDNAAASVGEFRSLGKFDTKVTWGHGLSGKWVLLVVAIVVQLSPKSCIISSFLQTESRQGDGMRKNFLRGIYLSVVAVSTLALGSDHLVVPKIAPEISKMDVWIGTWESQTQVMTTPYSEAASMTSEMTCTWSPHHGFILCDHLMNGAYGRQQQLIRLHLRRNGEDLQVLWCQQRRLPA